MGSAGNSNYAMAKAAIAALTISIAREMGKYGVTANFIAPRARTRMTDTMPNSSMFAKPESGFDAFNPAWPAQLVTFLASEAAGDINGQGFVVWGGEVTLVQRLAHRQPDQQAGRRLHRAGPDRAQGRAVRDAPAAAGVHVNVP